MVKARIKKRIVIEKQIDNVQKRFAGSAKRPLRDEIHRAILSGVTPVEGVSPRRFEKYSESYKKQIKENRVPGKNRVRPVNLKATGKLLKSLKVIRRGKRLIALFQNELADIHNRLGAGKSKVVRRMLPTEDGEQLSRNIMKNLRGILAKVIKKTVR